MISTKKRIDDIFKRIDNLNTKGLQLVLDMITDLENIPATIYYKIKVLDRHNNVIIEEDIHDMLREYIEKYTDKYNLEPRFKLYNIVNGKPVYQSTIAERENAEKVQEI